MATSTNTSTATWEPIATDSKPQRGTLIRIAGESSPLGKVVKIIGDKIKYKDSKDRIREIALGSELEARNDGGGAAAVKKAGTTKKSTTTKPAAKKPGPLDDYDKRMAEKEAEEGAANGVETEVEDDIEEEAANPAPTKSASKPSPSSSTKWHSIDEIAQLAGVPATRVAKLNREGSFDGLTRPDTDAKGPGRKPLLFSSEVLGIIANLPTPSRGGRKPASNDDSKEAASKRVAEKRAVRKAGTVRRNSETISLSPHSSGNGGINAILFHLDASILETRMQIERLQAALETLKSQRDVLVSIA